MINLLVKGALLVALLGLVSPAYAGSFQLYGPPAADAIIPGPPGEGNVLQVTSDPAGSGYGGMYYDATGDNLTLAMITKLSALYQMTSGTFGNGAPRFTLFDTHLDKMGNNDQSAYVYWGNVTGFESFADAHPGSYASTGNYADLTSSDLRVYVNGFGGQFTSNTAETWSQFVAALGSTVVQYVTLDLDGGIPTNVQQMITDEFTVNNNVYEAGPDPIPGGPTPEPATLTMLGVALAGFAGYRCRRLGRAVSRVS